MSMLCGRMGAAAWAAGRRGCLALRGILARTIFLRRGTPGAVIANITTVWNPTRKLPWARARRPTTGPSLLSTLDPSDTLWNADRLNMGPTRAVPPTRPPVRSRPASSAEPLHRHRSGKPHPASSCSSPAVCRIPLVPPRCRRRFRPSNSSSRNAPSFPVTTTSC